MIVQEMRIVFLATVASWAGAFSVPFRPGEYEIGQGVNSATLESLSPYCIRGLPPHPAPEIYLDTFGIDGHSSKWRNQSGLKTILEFKGVTSTHQLFKELSFAVGASASFLGVKAGVDISFVNNQVLSEYEAAYVLKMTVEEASVMRLNDTTAEFANELNSEDRINELCGDSFVESIQGGGVFYAIFRTDKESFYEKKGFGVGISMEGWDAHIEATIHRVVSNTKKASNLKISILSIGGDGQAWTESVVWNVSGLLEKANIFAKQVQDNPWPYKVNIRPWGSYFPGYNPNPQYLIDYGHARKLFTEIWDLYLQAKSVLRDVDFWANSGKSISEDQQRCLHGKRVTATRAIRALTKFSDELHEDITKRMDMNRLKKLQDMIPKDVDECLPNSDQEDDYVGCFGKKQLRLKDIKRWRVMQEKPLHKRAADEQLYDDCRKWALEVMEHGGKEVFFGMGGRFARSSKGKAVCFIMNEGLDERHFGEPRYGANDWEICGKPCVDDVGKWCGSSPWAGSEKKALYHFIPETARMRLVADALDAPYDRFGRASLLAAAGSICLFGMVVLVRRPTQAGRTASGVEMAPLRV